MSIDKLLEKYHRWRNPKYWAQAHATDMLQNARSHVWKQYWSSAASQSRGFVLQDTQDTLDLLFDLAGESIKRQIELL